MILAEVNICLFCFGLLLLLALYCSLFLLFTRFSSEMWWNEHQHETRYYRYVWPSHIARVRINRVKVFFPLSPFAPENLVSRDGFGSPVPRQPAHLPAQAESGAYLRDSSRVPRRRPFICLYCCTLFWCSSTSTLFLAHILFRGFVKIQPTT